MSDVALRFPAPHTHPFPEALKREVGAWFEQTGKSPNANAWMWTKVAVLLTGTVATWFVLLFVPLHGAVALGLAGVLGFFIAAVGMAVGHDALHGSMSSRPWVNRLFGLSFDLIGANSYIWRFTHNRNHHLYTNLEGVDLDLDLAPFLAVTPSVPRRAVHRWQHVYALGFYAFTTVHWLFTKDFNYFSMRRLGALRAVHHPWWAWTWLVVGKLFAWGTHLALPLLFAPYAWWQVLLGFGVAHLVGGLLMATVFQLAHQVAPTDFPHADAQGMLPFPFLVHQLRTTANFACENRPLSWLVGGLNFQVEHHLFPQVCSVHYPALRPIVREVAARYDVPYHEYPSVRAALAAHLGWLREQGAQAGAPPLG